MDIVVSHQEGRVPVTVFHVTGQITEESYEQLQKQGEAAFQAGMRNLLLDLTDVSFISSSIGRWKLRCRSSLYFC